MNLGFVGLGAMGQLIVPRLLAAGHAVTGWNRSRDKAAPLVEAGMRWADTPRAVAAESEIVFSIVTDPKAVRAVALGEQGVVAGLRRGGIFIDMSTIEPDESRAIAVEFSRAGTVMLDGPLSGSPVTVKQGNASIMIGGDEAAFERVRPVLLAIGPKVTRIGGNGLACQMKIAVNLLLMVEVICFGETVRLPRRAASTARLRSMPCSKASPPRRCSAIADRSFSMERCRRCRLPTSPCSKRICCSPSILAGNSAARCRLPQRPTR